MTIEVRIVADPVRPDHVGLAVYVDSEPVTSGTYTSLERAIEATFIAIGRAARMLA